MSKPWIHPWNLSRATVKPNEVAIGNEISDLLSEVTTDLEILRDCISGTTEAGKQLWQKYEPCTNKVEKFMMEMASRNLPSTPKPRFLMRTDKGPGVSITNFEVKFRDAELARLFNLDWQMRIHLAVNDPCPAERTNACIGDAVSDGGSLPFNKFQPHQEISESDLENITSEEIKALEEECVERNVWYCCQEVCDRIDESPGPHGYMSAHVTPRPECQFFYNTKYLMEYHTAGSKSELVPGHCYFRKVELFIENHYEDGDNYREFIKCSDLQQCSTCQTWVGPSITKCPRPYPDWSALPDYHYVSYSETPIKNRDVDDWQPRTQLIKWFEDKKVVTADPDSVATFADKLIVKPKLVFDYLQHLEIKEYRKEKRKQEKAEAKQKAQDKEYCNYDWDQLVQNVDDLKKLRVAELNKYLLHHDLNDHLKKRKDEKMLVIQNHHLRTESEPASSRIHTEDEDTDAEEEESEYEDVDQDDNDEDDNDEVDDLILAVIGNDDDKASPNVSRSGRKIVNRNELDYFYF